MTEYDFYYSEKTDNRNQDYGICYRDGKKELRIACNTAKLRNGEIVKYTQAVAVDHAPVWRADDQKYVGTGVIHSINGREYKPQEVK
jgi:hypothetical protein